MKIKSNFVSIGLILGLFVIGGCTRHQEHDHAGKVQDQAAKEEVAATIYSCPMHPEVKSDKEGRCPECGMNLVPQTEDTQVKESMKGVHMHEATESMQGNPQPKPAEKKQIGEKLYVCPMHPQITSEKKGECPICGMDLVPVSVDSGKQTHNEAIHPKGHVPITLSSARQQMIGVKTGRVVKKALFKKIRAPGRVAFDPELYTAQSEYQEALRQLRRVKKSPLESVKRNVIRMIESSKIRLRVLGLSEEQIRAIKPNDNLSESLLVYKKGSPLWIYADVFEMDLRNIKKGQAVKLTANYLEGKTILGVVESTDEVINSKTRTAKVRIRAQNGSIILRPESYVDVNILVPQGEHLAIPLDAIVDTGEEMYVFVTKGDGRFEPRKIRAKFFAGEEVAVAEGLSEHEDIVTSANFLIDSESRLKSVMNEMFASAHNH